MIGPNAYNAEFYSGVAPIAPAVTQSAADDDAAAAADFARILNAPAPDSAPARTASAAKAAPAAEETESHGFLSFIKGIFDVINPLQHIPVVGAIYRHITGDEISPVAHLAGDALYGGPIGAAIAVADISYEKITGKDVGSTMIAAVTGPKNSDAPETMLAQNMNDQISPAAGDAPRIADIIWDTPSTSILASNSTTNSRLSSAPPLPLLTGTDVNEPMPHSTPTPALVQQAKGNDTPTFKPPTASKVDSTIVFHPQEAPAVASRTDVPPELIAARMMDALDKYRDMKSSSPDAMMISGIY